MRCYKHVLCDTFGISIFFKGIPRDEQIFQRIRASLVYSAVSLLLSLSHIGPPLLSLHLINSPTQLCILLQTQLQKDREFYIM